MKNSFEDLNKNCRTCGVKLTSENTREHYLKHYNYRCFECTKNSKRKPGSKLSNPVPLTGTERSRLSRESVRKNNPIKYTCAQMRSSAFKRAKKFNLEFNIDTEYLISISSEKCPIMGYKIKYGGGELTKYSASLDRINPKKGYIKGNVQILCSIANTMKSNSTKEDMKRFAEWINENI